MGYFNTDDNRWKNVRFKKMVIAAYALFALLAATLVLRTVLNVPFTIGQQNFPAFIIAAACISVAGLIISVIIWQRNKEKGYKFIDVFYPVGSFAGCGIIIAMHIWMMPVMP